MEIRQVIEELGGAQSSLQGALMRLIKGLTQVVREGSSAVVGHLGQGRMRIGPMKVRKWDFQATGTMCAKALR